MPQLQVIEPTEDDLAILRQQTEERMQAETARPEGPVAETTVPVGTPVPEVAVTNDARSAEYVEPATDATYNPPLYQLDTPGTYENLDEPNVVNPLFEEQGTMSRGWDRGVANLQTTFGAAQEYVGEKLGLDGLAESGRENIDEGMFESSLRPAEVGEWENVHNLDSFVTYGLEAISENAPNAATMIGPGFLANVGTRATLATVGKNWLTTQAKREAKKRVLANGTIRGYTGFKDEAAKQIVGSTARTAGNTTAAAAIYPQHLGEGWLTLREAGFEADDVNSPWFTAAINTVLDVGAMDKMISLAFPGIDKTLARDLVNAQMKTAQEKGLFKYLLTNTPKDVLKASTAAFAIESTTEVAQEIVNLTALKFYNPEYQIFSEENNSRLLNAWLKGGIAGGGMSGGGRTVSSTIERMSQWLQAQPATSPAAPAAQAPATPAAQPAQPTIEPEGAKDLNAQFMDMQNPQSVRQSVWVPAGSAVTPEIQAAIDAGDVYQINIPGKQGGVAIVNKGERGRKDGAAFRDIKKKLEADPKASIDAELNDILYNGVARPKSEGTGTVAAVTPDGATAAEVVTPLNDQAAVVVATEQVQNMSPGSTVETRTPEQAIDQRVQNREQSGDALYQQAVDLVVSSGRASPSGLQRQMGGSYEQAVALISRMEAEGIVSPLDSNGKRTVLKQAPQTTAWGTTLTEEQAYADSLGSKTKPNVVTPTEADWTPPTQASGATRGAAQTVGTEEDTQGVYSSETSDQLALDISKILFDPNENDGQIVPPSRQSTYPRLVKILTDALAYTDERVSALAEKSGDTTVTFDPVQLRGNAVAGRALVQKLLNAIVKGQQNQKNRLTFSAPDGYKSFHVAAPELTQAGALLLGMNYSSMSNAEAASAFYEGLTFFRDRGFTLSEASEKNLNNVVIKPAGQVTYGRAVTPNRGKKGSSDGRARNAEIRGRIGEATTEEELDEIAGELDSMMTSAQLAREEIRDPVVKNARVSAIQSMKDAVERRREDIRFQRPNVTLRDENVFEPVSGRESFVNQYDETILGENIDAADSNDTRGLESEDQQAEASADFARRTTPSSTAEERAQRREAINQFVDNAPKVAYGNPRIQKLADSAQKILAKIGLNNVRAFFVDNVGIDELVNTLKLDRVPGNAKRIESLRNAKQSRIVFLDHPRYPDGSVKIPVIVIPESVSRGDASIQLAHELGHLVMRHHISAAPNETQAALLRLFGGNENIDENFANLFANWVFAQADTRAILKRMENSEDSNVVVAFLNDLKQAMTSFVRAAREYLGSYIPGFNDYMRTWMQLNRGQQARASDMETDFGREFAKAMNSKHAVGPEVALAAATPAYSMYLPGRHFSQEHADFTPIEALRTKFTDPKNKEIAKKFAERKAKSTRELYRDMKKFFRKNLGAADNWLRANNLVWLANKFHAKAGQRRVRSNGRNPIFVQMEIEEGRFNKLLMPIIRQLPKWSPLHMLPGRTHEYPAEVKAAVQQLFSGDPRNYGPLAKQISQYLDTVRQYLVDNNVNVKYRKDYGLPFMMNRSKLGEEGAKDAFTSTVTKWALSPEAKPYFQENFGQLPDQKLAEEFAQALFNAFTTTEGALEDSSMDEDALAFLSPGFRFKNARTIPRSLINQLSAWREDDLTQILGIYTRAAIRRGVWQSEFGMNAEIKSINMKFLYARNQTDYASRSAAFQAAKAHKEQVLGKLKNKYGEDFDLYNPSGQLEIDLNERLADGDITQEQYDFVVNKLLPAYQGRLGADISPRWRRFNSIMRFYQTVRVMSLSALSQFADIGLVLSRLPSGYRWSALSSLAGELMKKGGRSGLMDAARMAGVIRDDVTDHILNDDNGVLSLDVTIQRANEWFFRVNGMHAFTNHMRAFDMYMGKHVLLELARDGKVDELATLGVSPSRVKEWQAAGAPTSLDDRRFDDVVGALHQFVNESILKPNAATRPVVLGNDPKYTLIWHLKSFTWSYAYTVIPRIREEMVRKYGEEEGLRKFAAAMPVISLVVFSLPFAALGMELRWLIAPPKRGEPEFGGAEYLWQALQRTGALGLGQLLVDMNAAEQQGNPALVAVAGPAIYQLYSLERQGFNESWVNRAIPAYPIFNFGMSWFE